MFAINCKFEIMILIGKYSALLIICLCYDDLDWPLPFIELPPMKFRYDEFYGKYLNLQTRLSVTFICVDKQCTVISQGPYNLFTYISAIMVLLMFYDGIAERTVRHFLKPPGLVH